MQAHNEKAPVGLRCSQIVAFNMMLRCRHKSVQKVHCISPPQLVLLMQQLNTAVHYNRVQRSSLWMQAVDLQTDAPTSNPDRVSSEATKKSPKRTRQVATAMQASAQQDTPARQHAQHGGQQAQQEDDVASSIPYAARLVGSLHAESAASEGSAAPSRNETPATSGATSGTTCLLLLQLGFVC